MVHATSLDGQAERRLTDRIESAEADLEVAVEAFSERYFSCELNAAEAWEEWLNDFEYEWFTNETDVAESERK